MSDLTQKERRDLVRVLATVWKGADGDATIVEGRLTSDGQYPRPDAPRELNVVCSHNLVLAGDRPFKVGGGGVVIPCLEAAEPKVRYALKAARPSLFFSSLGAAERESEKAENEYLTHLPLAHENIAKMLALDHVDIGYRRHSSRIKLGLPFTLIEWVDGAEPLDSYIENHVTDPFHLADIVRQACRALGHLHDSGKVHWDIKGENVLVGGDGVVKLMDLGNARLLHDDLTRYRRAESAETTDRNLPPSLQERHRAAQVAASARVRERISNRRIPLRLERRELVWDRPWLDLYMLSREINRTFGFDESTLALDGLGRSSRVQLQAARDRVFADEEGAYVMRYLAQLFQQILAASAPQAAPFYKDAHEIVRVLERLRPDYGEATDVPELQPVPQHVLRIPPTVNVPWTPRVEALMNSSPLKRLKRHRQLATVHHVFAGAEHTRWEHVAGTFETMLCLVRALYADRSAVSFRMETSALDVTALMLATLLHDLGHPAFGHQLEESPVVPVPLQHEQYTLLVLRYCLSGTPQRPRNEMERDAAADAALIRPVLDRHWKVEGAAVDDLVRRSIELLEAHSPDRPREHDEDPVARARRVHTEVLGSLITGQLDADKSDYLVRDAHHCGVEYPNGIDRRRLDQALTALSAPREEAPDHEVGLIGVTEKGVLPLESLLVARYQMFRAVYWQHTVRAMTVMLQEAVEMYVARGANPAAINQRRLQTVLHIFRAQRDADALKWLAAELGPRGAELCRGIAGERDALFWEIVGFRGGLDGALPGGVIAHREELYRTLVRRWSRGATGVDGIELIRARRQFRMELAENMTRAAEIEFGGRVPTFRFDDVLLDVPVAGKDEVADLFVVHRDERAPEPIGALTPIARAVADAFETSVRPVRVFIRPSHAARFSGSPSQSERFARVVQHEVERLVDAQLPLPGMDDHPRG